MAPLVHSPKQWCIVGHITWQGIVAIIGICAGMVLVMSIAVILLVRWQIRKEMSREEYERV